MPDLDDILLFAQVVEAGSFASAARRLGKPANSVSRRIQELERRLGIQLMQRSTRKLVLTHAGIRLYRESASRLSEVLQLAQCISQDHDVLNGTVRFAATADFLESFRGEWIEEFLLAHPQVKLELLLDDARTDLLEYGVDLALRGDPPLDPQFVFSVVGRAQRILVASPRYLAAKGMPSTTADLVNHECLALLGRQAERMWRLEGPAGIEDVEISGHVSISTIRGSLLAAISGLGIAFIPGPLANAYLKSGELQEVLPGTASRAFDVYAVHRANTRLTKAAMAFSTFVSERLLASGLLQPPLAGETSEPIVKHLDSSRHLIS